jgi:DNA repair protein RecN (Recombination protein N)
MLVELRVVDLGVIADTHLVLDEGMTVITGETGAGKTLLVEAIDLLVGGRADPVLVRPGAAEAVVEARFVVGDGDDAEEVVVARIVPARGRSRATVNGRMATAAELAELGARLVDLHGQHTHQSLLSAAVQRDALDRFAGPDALEPLAAHRAARQARRAIEAQLADLGGDTRARVREIDLLRFQGEEIDAAAIVDPDEDDRLADESDLLADAAAHREAAARAVGALSDGAIDALGEAIGALGAKGPFGDLADRLRIVQEEASELAGELRTRAEAVVDDPDRLAAVHERRRLLAELRRKYGDDLAAVLDYRKEIAERLAELESWEGRAAALEAEAERHDRAAAAAARRLGAARRAAAERLGPAVTDHLRQLAMPRAEFAVRVDEAEVTDDGADHVVFLLAANPGEPPLPLARVASGGELARTMLAVRRVLSEAPPTLVFDEVDAGIGGEAGLAVGRLLAAVAADHQVLCVTHLPQVAAWADQQVVVAKHEVDDRTVSEARPVVKAERVNEIARMLAGTPTDSARKHARELLANAARTR